ncbi:3-phytase [Sphingomonas zeicaulis]|uniref:phytase n=1 Tax=Sphingomonas zeicaulis TaxID=1632740 RepID=UPI003D1C25F9
MSESEPAATPAPIVTAEVTARGETDVVGTANADAADDPAVWRNPADPAKSLIVATDKKAGLYVYGLDGKTRSFIKTGRVNNVDLRADVPIGGTNAVLVVASDRSDEANAKIALFRLDTATAKLTALGTVPSIEGEAYGMCLYRDAGALYAFMVTKEGGIGQVALDLAGAKPTGRLVRRLKVGSQAEGCVVDERTQRLYVAEEDVGIWRFDSRPTGAAEAVSIAKVDKQRLFDDVEGLAIASDGANGGYLVVSSQGDNAYALYRLADDSYVGRFRIAKGKLGSTEETDGIEVIAGDFGPDFPGGIMIAQDGENAPAAQNFKLVAWDDVLKTLKLK